MAGQYTATHAASHSQPPTALPTAVAAGGTNALPLPLPALDATILGTLKADVLTEEVVEAVDCHERTAGGAPRRSERL
jgi:hypothetical protein